MAVLTCCSKQYIYEWKPVLEKILIPLSDFNEYKNNPTGTDVTKYSTKMQRIMAIFFISITTLFFFKDRHLNLSNLKNQSILMTYLIHIPKIG